jgi:hypothetical protein
MNGGTLTYNFEETADAQGGLLIHLLVEGVRVGTGRISKEALEQLLEQMGTERATIAAEMRRALLSSLGHRFGRVTLTEPREQAGGPLRFISRYTYQGWEELEMGVVWCDIIAEETGPESAPESVRHEMQHEVLRKIIKPGTVARELVEMYDTA